MRTGPTGENAVTWMPGVTLSFTLLAAFLCSDFTSIGEKGELQQLGKERAAQPELDVADD